MEFQKDWNFEIDGKVTFLGILEKYEEQFHKMWKAESTRASYSRDYENYILPYVNDRPIGVLKRKDFDEIISKLPQTKAEEEKVYNESTLRHIRHLIKVVVKTAAAHQECEDVLWGSIYSLPDTADERLDEQEFTRLRKSLTIPEEKKTAEELLRDPQQTGQKMGLALMFCLGLRNQEACGVNFGDVKPMVVAPDCFCMWVYKSTKVDSNELQKSGKTRNMDRVVPIPTVLLKLLFERRTFFERPDSQWRDANRKAAF